MPPKDRSLKRQLSLDGYDAWISQDSLMDTLTKRLEKGFNETSTFKNETIAAQRKTIELQNDIITGASETISAIRAVIADRERIN